MSGFLKRAAENPSASSSTGATAAFPVPTPSIEPTPAAGKQGPRGLSPRQNTSRVNTGAPPQVDAGAAEQKTLAPRGLEMLPKVASGEELMGSVAVRPTMQDLIKAAMVESAARVRVSDEAGLQQAKTAAKEKCAKCGKEKCACAGGMKTASGPHVEKLASALDFIAGILKEGADLKGPYGLTEHLQTSAPGVLEARSSTPLPDHKGQGVHVVPMHPGEQKAMKTERGATQMENTQDHAPELHHEMQQTNYGKKASVLDIILAKVASEKEEKTETEGMAEAAEGLNKARKAHEEENTKKESRAIGDFLKNRAKDVKDIPKNVKQVAHIGQELKSHAHDMPERFRKGMKKDEKTGSVASLVDYMLSRTKVAEDAINPAQISAGPAVPPDTSAAGESGGAPVGGAPQGPTGLVASADAARDYTKGQAYENRKRDLGMYFDEPALKAEHDRVLQVAFENTGKAGPKIASADGTKETVSPASESIKTASARVLLSRLAANAQAQGG